MRRKTLVTRLTSWLLTIGLVATSVVPVNAEQSSTTTGDGTSGVVGTVVAGPTAQENATAYNIYPIPQDIDYDNGSFTLLDDVVIVKEAEVDEYTENFLKNVLDNYKVKYQESDTVQEGKTNIILGVKDDKGVADEFVTKNGITMEKTDLFQQNDAYLLDASDKGIVILGKDTDATYYGVATLQMMFSSFAGEKFLNANIEDFATVATRGYIEGFYGEWNFDERVGLMRAMGNYKMNSYVYAAKFDQYHTGKWAELYPDDMIQKFKTLVEVGKETKVEFAWAVHLGQFFNKFTLADVQNKTTAYTSQYDKLIAKFDQLRTQAGITKFDILNDDFGSGSNEMVVMVLNQINKDLKEKGCDPIVYCPQGYNKAWSGNGAELEAMKSLDEDITIYWTGDDVNAPITQDTVNFLIEKTNHKPDFWLNYPVNEHAKSGMFLGDITHYARKNVTGLAGFHSNPSRYAYSNLVGLYQLAALIWNNNDYDTYAQEVWESAFDYLQPEVAEEYLTIGRNIANCPNSSRVGKGFPESEYLKEKIEAVEALVSTGKPIKDDENAQAIYNEFKNILSAIEGFRAKCANKDLVKELDPWLNSLKDLATAGRDALESLFALEGSDASTGWEKLSSASAAYDTKYTYKAYTYIEPNSDVIAKAGSKRLDPFVGKLISAARNNLTPILNPNDDTFTPTLFAKLGGQVQAADDNGKKMYDGNESTYASWKVVQQAGDYFGLDLGRVIPVRDITILQGQNDTHHDIFNKAKLEYSEDGEKWTDIENPTVELNNHKIHIEGLNIKARFIRYALTEVGTENKEDYWTHVREFTVNKKVEKQHMVYTNVEALAETPVTMEKPNIGIGGLTNVSLEKGDYVGFVLTDPVVATNFEQEFSNGNDLTVEYSVNGQQWTTVSDSFEKDVVKYLRVINKTESAVTTDISKLELTVQTFIPEPSIFLSTMANGFAEGGVEQIFDGEPATYALTASSQEKDSYLIFDLGNMLDIHDVEIVTNDGAKTLHQARIQVLKDNTTWEDIGVVNDDTIFDVPYRYVRCNGEGVQARYLRIYITENNDNPLQLHEIKINEKVELPTEVYPVFSTVEGNTSAIADGDITSLFSAEVKNDDYVEYRIFENTNVDQVSVVLGKASEHGKVYAVTPTGEVELGDLTKTVNTFDTTKHDVITAIKIKWTGSENVAIHEIFVSKGADASGNVGKVVAPILINKAELEVAIAEAEVKAESDGYTAASKEVLTQALEEANTILEDADATAEEIQQAITKLAEALAGLKAKGGVSSRHNIALGKSATVSGTSSGAKENITDGKTDTKWDSEAIKGANAAEESWFVVDLGEDVTIIESMKVSYFNLVYPTIYKVQVSNDNANWFTVKDLTRDHGGAGHPIDEITFEKPVSGRYVRMLFEEINQNAAGHGVGVKEAEIMGRVINEDATLSQIVAKEAITMNQGETFDATQLTNFQEIQVSVPDVQEKINVLVGADWNTDAVNSNQSGTYEVVGTLSLGSIQNPQNLTAKVNVIVQGENDIPVESITLNQSEVTLTLGETETATLEATVTPDNATHSTVTWSSDAQDVVSVENGVVTAHKAGTAVITATAGGQSATCTVTVEEKQSSGDDGEDDNDDDAQQELAAAKAALEATIAEANTKVETEYTEESWTPFAIALEAAKAEATKADATKATLEAAKTDLEAAMKALVEVQGGGNEEEGGNDNEEQHTPSKDWSKDATHHWHVCTFEGCEVNQKHDLAAHKWDAGKVTKQPTATATGEKTFTCTVCGQTKKEVVQATGTAGGNNNAQGGNNNTQGGNNAAVQEELKVKQETAEINDLKTQGANLKTDEYTTDSWNTYQAALNKVNTLISSGKATSAELNQAKVELKTALGALVKAPATQTPEEKPVEVVKPGVTFQNGTYQFKITSATEAQFTGVATSIKTVKIANTIPYGGKTLKVTSIANNALKGDKVVTKVVLGSNIKNIGNSAFENCTKLTSVNLKNVTKIGNKAFKKCTSLKKVTIPKKVTNLGKSVFEGCKKLSTITIKATALKRVGKNTFKSISAKAKIKVPKKNLAKYKKLLKNKGQGKKVTVK